MSQKFIFGMMGVCMTALMGAGSVQARAIDDAKFIMDIRGELSGTQDGESNNVGNALDFSAANPIKMKWHCSGTGVAPRIVSYDVGTPMHPMTTNAMPAVYVSQSDIMDGETQKFSTDYVVFENAAVNSSQTQTAFIRFRWDGAPETNTNKKAWIFRNGHGSTGFGWGFYIQQLPKTSLDYGYLGFSARSKANASKSTEIRSQTFTIKKGVWYDLFVSVLPNDIQWSEFRAWAFPTPETVTLQDEGGRVAFKAPTFTYEKNAGSGNWAAIGFKDSLTEITFGGAPGAHYIGYQKYNGSNYGVIDVFRGAVSQLMVWDRMLTMDEMNEVRSGYHGAVISAGVVNGSGNEFTDVEPAETFGPTSAWRTMRKTLTEENPSVSLSGVLPKDAVGSGHLLSVTPIFSGSSTAPCVIRVTVNGTRVGDYDLKSSSSRTIFIPGERMTRDGDGHVNVTLTRLAPFTETLTLDAVSLGGSWCVGEFNGTSGDFERETCVAADVIIGDAIVKHAPDKVRGEGNDLPHTIRIHAYLPYHPEVGVNNDGTLHFDTRLAQDSSNKLDIWINDVCVTNLTGITQKTSYKIPISRAWLQPGMNIFAISNAMTKAEMTSGTSYNYVCFDALKFTLKRERIDTTILIR